mmetsp:Transcript_92504/g.287926  ORF Transcript_92504/g.287926 Transcript_92504/m.287926 type:complete len:260 (+) Transcript_92504:478-1257(+)
MRFQGLRREGRQGPRLRQGQGQGQGFQGRQPAGVWPWHVRGCSRRPRRLGGERPPAPDRARAEAREAARQVRHLSGAALGAAALRARPPRARAGLLGRRLRPEHELRRGGGPLLRLRRQERTRLPQPPGRLRRRALLGRKEILAQPRHQQAPTPGRGGGESGVEPRRGQPRDPADCVAPCAPAGRGHGGSGRGRGAAGGRGRKPRCAGRVGGGAKRGRDEHCGGRRGGGRGLSGRGQQFAAAGLPAADCRGRARPCRLQ